MIRYFLASAFVLSAPQDGLSSELEECLASPGANITYRSDDGSPAYSWLEAEQRKIFGERTPTQISEITAILRSMDDKRGWGDPLEILCKSGHLNVQLPTRYEELPSFLIFSESVRSVLAVAGPSAKPILWGTLPARDINASAREIENEHLILINHQIHALLYSALLTINRSVISPHENGQIVRTLDSSERASAAWGANDVMLYQSLIASASGDASPGTLALASNDEAVLLITQLNSIYNFITGHEVSHVKNGDIASSARFMNVPLKDGRVEMIPSLGYDWAREIQADINGFVLAQKAYTPNAAIPSQLQPLDRAIYAYAPVVYMYIADAAERSSLCGNLASTPGVSVSHEDRTSVVEDIIKQFDTAKQIVVSKDQARILGCRQSSHPPQWLRAEVLLRRIDKLHEEAGLIGSAQIQIARSFVLSARAASEALISRKNN